MPEIMDPDARQTETRQECRESAAQGLGVEVLPEELMDTSGMIGLSCEIPVEPVRDVDDPGGVGGLGACDAEAHSVPVVVAGAQGEQFAEADPCAEQNGQGQIEWARAILECFAEELRLLDAECAKLTRRLRDFHAGCDFLVARLAEDHADDLEDVREGLGAQLPLPGFGESVEDVSARDLAAAAAAEDRVDDVEPAPVAPNGGRLRERPGQD